MKSKHLIFLLFAFVVVFTFTPGFAASKPVKIKFAHLAPAKPFDSDIHSMAVAFKYIVEKRTGGQIEVDIYHSGTLGKEIDLIEAVKNNVIQLHIASMGGLARIFPPALLHTAPYAIKNEAIGRALIDGPFTQKLLEAFTNKTGIKGLGIFDSACYHVFTNNIRQIHTPADMKGMKFRAMDPLQIAMFKALGASAVPISWPEVYTSLQTGVVHGQSNPISIVEWAKLYEVQKYITAANSIYGVLWLVANKEWYDSLSLEHRGIIQDAIMFSKDTRRGLGILLEQSSIKKLKEIGMDVYCLNDNEVSEFQKLARPACLEFLKGKMDPKWVDEFLIAIKEAESSVSLGYK